MQTIIIFSTNIFSKKACFNRNRNTIFSKFHLSFLDTLNYLSDKINILINFPIFALLNLFYYLNLSFKYLINLIHFIFFYTFIIILKSF